MCGIVGIFDMRQMRDIDLQLLTRMNETQHHRGPVEGGVHCEPGIGFGHRRLSIIDLSSGQQPLFNEDHSVVLVFNGDDDEALAAARGVWTDCKARGFEVTYWQADERGRWQRRQ